MGKPFDFVTERHKVGEMLQFQLIFQGMLLFMYFYCHSSLSKDIMPSAVILAIAPSE